MVLLEKTVHFILGFSNDKDIESISKVFPQKSEYYFVESNVGRAMQKEYIKDVFQKSGKKGVVCNSVSEAFTIAKGKSENNDIVVTIQPDQHYLRKDIYPLSGISNSQTIHCNENGYYTLFESDRYGFNNPDDQWDKDNIEFFIVGDSFAMGECVNRPYDLSLIHI